MINLATLIVVIALVVVTIYWYDLGILSDVKVLQSYIARLGLTGALFFVVIQVIQVVIPIIPGGISTAAGVILLARGLVFSTTTSASRSDLLLTFSCPPFWQAPADVFNFGKTYEKYIGYTKNQTRFDHLFTLAIVLPVAPDDVLCLLAGLTKMTFTRFFWIIILGKPITIFAYSMSLLYGGRWLIDLFS